MALCCRRNQITNENEEENELISIDKYKIVEDPKEPVIDYKNSNFHSKKNIFIYKNKEYITKNMKWIDIQSFKLYYLNRNIQCVHIKNRNTKSANKLILFSQGSNTNLGSALPFLLNLSNYLKMNILTYEYFEKNEEKQCNSDINIIFAYLNKIATITEIILMGQSIGNIINMNIIISKINKKLKKIKSFIMISPTWKFSYVSENIRNKRGGIKRLTKYLDTFFSVVNQQKINIFLIHGKKDYFVKYYLTLSLSQRIEKLTVWYPKNGNHYGIVNECRTKLLSKIKNYLNNEYSLPSSNKKKLDKKSQIMEFGNESLEKSDIIDTSDLTNKSNFIYLTEFEKEEYNIEDADIIYNGNKCTSNDNCDNYDAMSFKGGDLIPSFKDKGKNKILLSDQQEDNNSIFSFTQK